MSTTNVRNKSCSFRRRLKPRFPSLPGQVARQSEQKPASNSSDPGCWLDTAVTTPAIRGGTYSTTELTSIGTRLSVIPSRQGLWGDRHADRSWANCCRETGFWHCHLLSHTMKGCFPVDAASPAGCGLLLLAWISLWITLFWFFSEFSASCRHLSIFPSSSNRSILGRSGCVLCVNTFEFSFLL